MQQAALLVIGRLLHPGSERETAAWAKEMSALDEILGADFKNLSNNALYRLADLLVAHRAEIEVGLARAARIHESSFGQRGRSKEKRHDRPLLTLALVLDGDGFPKAPRVFPGNISGPGTLMEMLQTLREEMAAAPPLFQPSPTVVIDAGLASAANLEAIQTAGFSYIAVSRSRPQEMPASGMVVIKETNATTIQVQRLDQDGEVIPGSPAQPSEHQTTAGITTNVVTINFLQST